MNSLGNIVRNNREAVQRGHGIPGAIGTAPIAGEIPPTEGVDPIPDFPALQQQPEDGSEDTRG